MLSKALTTRFETFQGPRGRRWYEEKLSRRVRNSVGLQRYAGADDPAQQTDKLSVAEYKRPSARND